MALAFAFGGIEAKGPVGRVKAHIDLPRIRYFDHRCLDDYGDQRSLFLSQ